MFAETASPYLYFQPTVPAFEYPRRDLPPQVRFVGPLLPPVPPAAELPAWWEQVTSSARKVVLVTQGTISTDPSELLRPALEALAREPVHVIAVTGGPDPAEVGPVPANAHVERFVPFGPLMPHLSAMVTNGGYGGLHFAMSHGVPVVVAGATEDKPELLQRVRFSGVGVGMRTQSPKPERLRRAVRRVLDEPRFARRAHEMAAEMAAHRGPATAADLVEELAARRGTRLARPGEVLA
jgi:MGT family glycosyltransferase